MKPGHLPTVSCYCATYGRPHLLEEAIESFLRQQYKGRKELVVLNDLPEQTLIFDHPEVKIHNVERQVIPLGRKFNQVVQLCSGEILFPWEDDDIYLPWRIALSVDRLRDGVFHTGLAWQDDGGAKLTFARNLFHCNLAVSQQRWKAAGGYYEQDVSAIDANLFHRLGSSGLNQQLEADEIFYVYRWSGTGSYHGSGLGGYRSGISAMAREFVSKEVREGRLKTGKITLRPHWTRDYERLASHAATRHVSRDEDWIHPQSDARAWRPFHPGFDLGDQLVIPPRRNQEITILDPLSAAIWRGLHEKLSANEVAELIAQSLNIDPAAALQDIQGIMQDWHRADLLVEPEHQLTLLLGKQKLRIECDSEKTWQLLSPSIQHLSVNAEEPPEMYLRVAEHSNDLHIFCNGERVATERYPDAAAARVLQRVHELAAQGPVSDLTLQAGVLLVGDNSIVFPSMNGSLPRHLLTALWESGRTLIAGENIHLESNDGRFLPLPTSLRIDARTWQSSPSISAARRSLPVYMHGKDPVRFLPCSTLRSIDAARTYQTHTVIFAEHRAGVDVSISELSRGDGLRRFLNQAAAWPCEVFPTFLARTCGLLSQARCLELTYESAAKAEQLIEQTMAQETG